MTDNIITDIHLRQIIWQKKIYTGFRGLVAFTQLKFLIFCQYVLFIFKKWLPYISSLKDTHLFKRFYTSVKKIWKDDLKKIKCLIDISGHDVLDINTINLFTPNIKLHSVFLATKTNFPLSH